MKSIGMVLVVAGIFLVVAGLLFMLSGKFPIIGHLPGDIHFQGKNVSFSYPLATCIIFSIILTIVLNIIFRLINK